MLTHGAKFDGLETWDQIAENKEQLHLLCDPKLFAQFSSAVLSIIPCEAVILKEFCLHQPWQFTREHPPW
jgi:hypothetical protein